MTREELDRLDSEGLNSLFYKRLFAEQKAYTAWLQTLSPGIS